LEPTANALLLLLLLLLLSETSDLFLFSFSLRATKTKIERKQRKDNKTQRKEKQNQTTTLPTFLLSYSKGPLLTLPLLLARFCVSSFIFFFLTQKKGVVCETKIGFL